MRDQAQRSTAMTTKRKQILNEGFSFHKGGWWKRLDVVVQAQVERRGNSTIQWSEYAVLH
jgi:hypothetical protein